MFKVRDKVIVSDYKKAGICSYFQDKILIVRKVKDDRLFINSDEFLDPDTGNRFGEGWVLFEGIRKATPLDKLI